MAASLSPFRHQLRKTFLKVNLQRGQGKCVFFSSVIAKDLNNTKDVVQTNDYREEPVQYPPVKPKYPPGEWGDMEPGYAWLWQNTIDDLSLTSDVKGRQDTIISKEMTHLNALTHSDHPNYLNFAKYATKTSMFPWSDTPFDLGQSVMSENNEALLQKVKKIIADQLLIEEESVQRMTSHNFKTQPMFSRKRAQLVLRCIFDTLITNQSGSTSHLRTCQYDEDVIVRAVWDRYGIERKRKHRLTPSHLKMDKVLDQRLTSSCIFDAMTRSHIPLPEFQPRSSGLSTESKKPSLEYKHPSYGVTKTSGHKLKSILAGHVLGDPCEYGLVGLLLTNNNRSLDEKFGPKVAKECRLGRGLTSTFTWLAAQAYNQGFSGFIDLTYPLTSQTVLSDGQNFSFLACQLNTLELWKPDSANNMANLCWHSDEMALFDTIENGEVKGFNEDVLRMLMKMFQLAPADRGYDMKPTITDKDINLHQKRDFIPEKVEEIEEEEEEQYIV